MAYKKIISVILMLQLPVILIAQEYITVDKSQKSHTIEGWGVSLCWWAYQCGQWEEAKIDSIVDWLVSPEGLNYNIFRYNIGGGDDPQNRHCDLHHMARGKGERAEMPGFKLYPDSPYDWTADSAQLKILRKIKERRPDAIFEAFSNSAPWYMTYSGCCGGNDNKTTDNLRTEYYKDFAQYLIDVCRHIKECYGIEFRTLDPFNEPQTDYWYRNGSQEGCHFDISSQIEMVKILYPMLIDSKLKTVISASDETCIGHSINSISSYGDALRMIGQWNTHSYYGSAEEKVRLRELADSFKIRLWQSETGDGGHGIHGNIKMLQRLFEDMKCLRPSAWCDWQYFGEHDSQWCLISGDHKLQQYYRTKNYYIRQQVSRFIKPGYTIINIDYPNVLAAYSAAERRIVVVCLNIEKVQRDIVIDIKGTDTQTAEIYTTNKTQNLSPGSMKLNGGKINVSLSPLEVKTIIADF